MDLFANLYFMAIATGQQALAQATDVAATATAAQPASPPAYMQFMPFVIIITVFYFFIIRPQAKRQKETQSFLTSLKVGDQIITASGILGRITALNEKTATIEVANQVQIKVLRAQVTASQAILQDKQDKKEGN